MTVIHSGNSPVFDLNTWRADISGLKRLGGQRGPLGPLGFEGAQHRQTLRPSVDGVRSKALQLVAHPGTGG